MLLLNLQRILRCSLKQKSYQTNLDNVTDKLFNFDNYWVSLEKQLPTSINASINFNIDLKAFYQNDNLKPAQFQVKPNLFLTSIHTNSSNVSNFLIKLDTACLVPKFSLKLAHYLCCNYRLSFSPVKSKVNQLKLNLAKGFQVQLEYSDKYTSSLNEHVQQSLAKNKAFQLYEDYSKFDNYERALKHNERLQKLITDKFLRFRLILNRALKQLNYPQWFVDQRTHDFRVRFSENFGRLKAYELWLRQHKTDLLGGNKSLFECPFNISPLSVIIPYLDIKNENLNLEHIANLTVKDIIKANNLLEVFSAEQIDQLQQYEFIPNMFVHKYLTANGTYTEIEPGSDLEKQILYNEFNQKFMHVAETRVKCDPVSHDLFIKSINDSLYSSVTPSHYVALDDKLDVDLGANSSLNLDVNTLPETNVDFIDDISADSLLSSSLVSSSVSGIINNDNGNKINHSDNVTHYHKNYSHNHLLDTNSNTSDNTIDNTSDHHQPTNFLPIDNIFNGSDSFIKPYQFIDQSLFPTNVYNLNTDFEPFSDYTFYDAIAQNFLVNNFTNNFTNNSNNHLNNNFTNDETISTQTSILESRSDTNQDFSQQLSSNTLQFNSNLSSSFNTSNSNSHSNSNSNSCSIDHNKVKNINDTIYPSNYQLPLVFSLESNVEYWRVDAPTNTSESNNPLFHPLSSHLTEKDYTYLEIFKNIDFIKLTELILDQNTISVTDELSSKISKNLQTVNFNTKNSLNSSYSSNEEPNTSNNSTVPLHILRNRKRLQKLKALAKSLTSTVDPNHNINAYKNHNDNLGMLLPRVTSSILQSKQSQRSNKSPKKASIKSSLKPKTSTVNNPLYGNIDGLYGRVRYNRWKEEDLHYLSKLDIDDFIHNMDLPEFKVLEQYYKNLSNYSLPSVGEYPAMMSAEILQKIKVDELVPTTERVIFHCDINNCYASIEMKLNPSLRGKAIIVCGDQAERHGIVLAKSDLAKKAGIITGEAVVFARKKCEDLICIPPNYAEYKRHSKMAHDIYKRYTNKIESMGIDECWLDVTETLHLFNLTPLELAHKIRQEIKKELGITISVGVSFNKVFAKLGSDLKKPNAVTEISYSKMREIVWPLAIEEMIGIGKKTTYKINSLGINTIGKLANTSPDILYKELGISGLTAWINANGLNFSDVHKIGTAEEIKSISHGMTLVEDISDRQTVVGVFQTLALDTCKRLMDKELFAKGVQITVKRADFTYCGWQKQLDIPTVSVKDMVNAAMELFDNNYKPFNPIRSLTIRAINLVTINEFQTTQDIFSDFATYRRNLALQQAIYKIHSEYGREKLQFATILLDLKLTNRAKITFGEKFVENASED